MDILQSPYELAESVYQSEPCARSFMEDLRLHMLHGYVFNTPRLFLMGRSVSKLGDAGSIVDPTVSFNNADCWHIYLAAGDLSEFFKFEPFPLPWFSWERNNKLRFYRRERLTWLLRQQSSKKAEWDVPPHLLRHLRQPQQLSELAKSIVVPRVAGL